MRCAPCSSPRTGSLSRNEFEAFAGRLLQNQSAIQSMSWVPRVTRAERGAVEAAARADGLAGYTIKFVAADNRLVPALEHEEYFPIYYSTEKPRTSPVYGIICAPSRCGDERWSARATMIGSRRRRISSCTAVRATCTASSWCCRYTGEASRTTARRRGSAFWSASSKVLSRPP